MRGRESADQIPVRVELSALLQVNDGTREEIRLSVDSRIAKLCDALGIPGSVKTEVSQSQVEDDAAFFKLWVNGKRVRYSRSLARRVHGYLVGELPVHSATLEPVFNWFLQQAEQKSENAALFVSLTCEEAVKCRPSVLLNKGSALTYLRALEKFAPDISALNSGELSCCLSGVLDKWISIADQPTIANLISQHKDKPVEHTSQEVVSARSTDRVEIRMPSDYMRAITSEATQADRDSLPWLRDGLFEELGLTFPTFQFVTDDDLRPRSFAFQINDLVTLPRVALPHGTVLVNDTPEHLSLLQEIPETSLNSKTQPVVIPASEYPGALIPVETASPIAVWHGLTSWNPFGYLILCMADAFRTHAACFVTLRTVREMLSLLEQNSPRTVQAARTEITDQELTCLLQQLVAEEVSLRDLPSILERIIDREYLATESTSIAVLDDYPASVPWSSQTRNTATLTSFIRAGLRHRISAKLARDRTTVVTYLLDTTIEDMFLAADGTKELQEEDIDRILEAFSSELRFLPPTAETPGVLTSASIRPAVRSVLAQEHSRVSVIAHEELSSEYAVQPVARISLPAGTY